jgi:putative sigma-54 modulation protein
MQITIKSRNLDVADSLRDNITQKVEKLDRFLPHIEEARVDLVVQNAKSAQDRNVAQLTLRGTNGMMLRAEERSADMRASIDNRPRPHVAADQALQGQALAVVRACGAGAGAAGGS